MNRIRRKNKTPKVSIVIPVYNVEVYLRQCLDSVVNQTLQDVEIICVNDGSTDRSIHILKEYADRDPRIRIINKMNEGYGKAVNIGIDHATGEYLGIVEPDDFLATGMLKILYNRAKKTGVDIIKADYNRFSCDKNSVNFTYHKVDPTGKHYNTILWLKKNLNFESFKFTMMTWLGLYKRSFLTRYNIRHNETPGASYQDNGFWFQTMMFAKTLYLLDQPYYNYRTDNPNSSINNRNKVFCIQKEYQFIESIIVKNQKYRYKAIFHWAKFVNYLFNFKRIHQKYKRAFLEMFSNELNNARTANELNYDLFNGYEQYLINLLMDRPDKFYRVILNRPSLLEKFFSIKNSNDKRYKIITFLGLHIKLRRLRAI